MPLSEYQRIYDGFEHRGLRIVLDPERCRHEHHLEGEIVDVESGRKVGELVRQLEERDGELLARQYTQQLEEPYRGRGFTRAMLAHTTPRLIELGVCAMVITAHNLGSLIWGRWGFAFDQYGVQGATDQERIARSVAEIFDRDAPRAGRRRRFPPWPERLPNPDVALRRLERRGGDCAAAVAEMRWRIPTEERIRAGDLEGTFTSPAEIVAFESHGIAVGTAAMRWAHWRGIKPIDAIRL